MGSMAASDAAPLPRLGEVFFDVRGSSRSMRLSWYADTGIAVFSIWQGGTCTGTFRLPMDDLSRLVDSLHRGMPGGQDEPQELSPALESPRQRLAIGAAPEPYTGALISLGATALSQPGLPDGRYADRQGTLDPQAYPGAQGYAAQEYSAQEYSAQEYGAQRGYNGSQGYPDAAGGYPADASSFGAALPHANGHGPAHGQGYEDPRAFDGSPRYPEDWQGAGDGQSYPVGQSYGQSYGQQQPYGDGGAQGFPDPRSYQSVAPVGVAGGPGNEASGPQRALGYGPGSQHEPGGQGFIPRGYDAQGYAMPGYAEQVPTGPDYPDGGFGNRGYGLQEPTPQAYPQVLSAPVEPAPAGMRQFTGPMPATVSPSPVAPPFNPSAGQAVGPSAERFPLAYREQPAYPDQPGYPGPAGYGDASQAEQARYLDQGGHPETTGYLEQPGYPERGDYPEPGREQGFRNGTSPGTSAYRDDSAYAGTGGYPTANGYPGPGAYPDAGYDGATRAGAPVMNGNAVPALAPNGTGAYNGVPGYDGSSGNGAGSYGGAAYNGAVSASGAYPVTGYGAPGHPAPFSPGGAAPPAGPVPGGPQVAAPAFIPNGTAPGGAAFGSATPYGASPEYGGSPVPDGGYGTDGYPTDGYRTGDFPARPSYPGSAGYAAPDGYAAPEGYAAPDGYAPGYPEGSQYGQQENLRDSREQRYPQGR
jgi:hypothetical protein